MTWLSCAACVLALKIGTLAQNQARHQMYRLTLFLQKNTSMTWVSICKQLLFYIYICKLFTVCILFCDVSQIPLLPPRPSRFFYNIQKSTRGNLKIILLSDGLDWEAKTIFEWNLSAAAPIGEMTCTVPHSFENH